MPGALRAAQSAIRREDYPAAIALLEPALERRPQSFPLALHLAMAKAAVGEMDEAMALFEQARRNAPHPHVIDRFAGEAFLRHDQPAEAEELLRKSLEADKSNTLTANYLALSLFRQGRHSEAMDLWAKHGWTHNRDYLIEITIAFEQFLLQVPAAPPVLDDDADPGEIVRGQHKRPLSAWGRHMRLKPMLNQAEKYLTSQRTLEAYRLTCRALEMDAENHDALLLRAISLYEMERYEEAGRILLGLAGEESFLLPRYFLAYSLLRLGQIEVAEAMMNHLSPQGPFDYYLHYHLGLCRLLGGDRKGAREAFGIAYRDYFIDSREYCFEHLVKKVRAAVERFQDQAGHS